MDTRENQGRSASTLSAAQINVPNDVATARTIAAYLASMPVYQRREVASKALALAGSETLPIITLTQGIGLSPKLEDVAKIISGQNQLLLAISQLGPDATVKDVLKYADSIGTGIPFVGDPSIGGSVPFSAAILAALPSFRDIKPGQEQEVVEFLKRLTMSFDCATHDGPVGAAPISGGLFDWVKKIFPKKVDVDIPEGQPGSDSNPIVLPDLDVTTNAPQGGPANATDGVLAMKQAAPKGSWLADIGKALSGVNVSANVPGTGSFSIGGGYGTTSWGGAGLGGAMGLMSTEAQRQMNNALMSLKMYASQSKQMQQEAKLNAMQAARAEWASALISAPDETMEVLAIISPDFSDLKKAIRTMMSVLPAARDTGDINVLQSLGYAIKGAITDGQLTQSVVASLMSGDPVLQSIFSPTEYVMHDDFSTASDLTGVADDLGLSESVVTRSAYPHEIGS